MITIGIDPVAFSLGPFEVRWYGIMVVLAVVAIIIIALLEARRVGISEEHVYSVGLWAILGGIIVSRLVHVIDKWDYYMAHPRHIIGFEGLTVYGAVIGAMLAVLIYAWVKKLSFWRLGDVIAPGAILGQAIGRIGCIINGCCYGLPTSLPWAVVYAHPSSYAPPGVPVHPTQIYHLLWNLAAFAVIWQLRTQLKPQGSLFLTYLALYAIGDLSIRFVRPGEPFLFGIQQAQLIGIAILVVAVPWLVIRMRQAKAETTASGLVIGANQSERNRED
ncbi:MAG TPA: prolipoprotein diacylglyceryl transferase [Dehalococcoidia bacterium]|nr:prolipoprotein diacylglyceryl transferase [Dehalococcoidia bacterium]